MKEKLQAVQDVTALVQNALGYVAHLAEGVKNTFNFSVPFLSYLAIVVLLAIGVVLYYINLRYLLIIWGINCSTKSLGWRQTPTSSAIVGGAVANRS